MGLRPRASDLTALSMPCRKRNRRQGGAFPNEHLHSQDHQHLNQIAPTRTLMSAAVVAAACLFSGTAHANAAAVDRQPLRIEQPDLKGTYEDDYVIVALGAGYVPDYEGADEYGVQIGGAVRGQVEGISFKTSGIGLEVDLIPNLPGDIELSFGPEIQYSATRTGKVKDEIVDMLPELDSTVELGFSTGISKKNLLTPVDSLSLSYGMRWDISGKGAGRQSRVSLSYFTALSKGMGAGVSVGASWHDDKWADYYYTITPEGSAATDGALPVYQAEGGMKDWDAKAYWGMDLDGDFRNGGFGIATSIVYERLQGSAAETPIVSMRGDRDQFMFLAGVGYAF